MPLELTPSPAPITPLDATAGPREETAESGSDRFPMPSKEHSMLSAAWHNLADASRRIERLQERLAALGVGPANTSLT